MASDFHFPSITDGRELLKDNKLDGQGFKALVDAGMRWLKANQQLVNALNVFPVPDGDTGTNMLLTMQAAYDEVKDSNETNIGKVAHAVAHGALMGARGNSGVILSQLWRGFARALDNFDSMDRDLLIKALHESRNTAYRGVVRPVEGTILAVAKDLAAAAQSMSEENIGIEWFEKLLSKANESVNNTPNLLPILKQAGVVDSGGKGLYIILEGMQRFVLGQSLELDPNAVVKPISALELDHAMEEVEDGQDFEVVLDFKPHTQLDLGAYYEELAKIGTSIQVGEGDGMYRMHIHVPAEKKYEPIEYTMTLGTVSKIAIENLLAQMEERKHNSESAKVNFPPVEPNNIALIAVSPGEGFSRILASLGVNGVISGGQTMNPSTEEIIRSFENLPTDKVIILPNNKNIILAAQNASQVSVKMIRVIPTKTLPQGISCTLRFDPTGDIDEVAKDMESAIKDVISGEITTATRSVEINGVDVKEGEVIALLDGSLVVSADTLEQATLELLENAKAEDYERISFYSGSELDTKSANLIVDQVREKYPSHEIEIHSGGQPYYQLIVSIE